MGNPFKRLVSKPEEVTVEGFTFLIRRMNLRERGLIGEKANVLQREGFSEETAMVIANVMYGAIGKESGKYDFADLTLDELRELPYTFVTQIFTEIMRVNRIGATAVEERKENFTETT